MRIFRRRAAADVQVAEAAYRPTEQVPVTVDLGETLTGVTSARVEIGYVNGYRYRWAGRRDAAANHDDSSFLTAGQVGTDYGSERDTEDWVAALGEDLAVAAGTVAAGSHVVEVRLPSWSPGSSSDTVRWESRLRIEHDGRDVEAATTFRVVVPAPDPSPEQVLEQGASALQRSLHWEIATDQPCVRVGDVLRGVLRITPGEPVTKLCEVAVQLIRERLSHPPPSGPPGRPPTAWCARTRWWRRGCS